MRRFFFLFATFCLAYQLQAQEWFIKKNLQYDWQVFVNQGYRPYDPDDTDIRTVYIKLEATNFKGDRIAIRGLEEFSIFIHGKLWADKKRELVISLDSLHEVMTDPLWIGIHSEGKISPQTLSTQIITHLGISYVSEERQKPRVRQPGRNFIVVGGIILLVFFVLIIRLNPRLTYYYFSVPRLFALRESDEGQFARVASSANILFYLFASILVSYVLMVMAFEYGDRYALLRFLQEHTFGMLIVRWIYMAVFVMGALVCKALVVWSFARLFGIRDQSGFHFLTFVRATLLLSFLIALWVAGGYLVIGGSEAWTAFFYSALLWFMIGWSILIFLKLLRRVNFSVFHLFSYLCVTELIPFLVTIKVLYE